MGKIIALQTETGSHLGFILFAGDGEPFSNVDWKGDCILTGPPKDAELFDHPLCKFIYITNKDEFSATVKSLGDGYRILLKYDDIIIKINIESNNTGYWQPFINGSSISEGKCVIPSNKSKP